MLRAAEKQQRIGPVEPIPLDPAAWTGVPATAEAAALPHLRHLAAESAYDPPDALFESVLTMLVAGVRAML